MAVLTRLGMVTEAKLHARSVSSTLPPQLAADWINLVCEIYQWVERFVTPTRWSYLSYGAYTIDGLTTVADTGLILTAANAYLMTTASRKTEQISDVFFSGAVALGSGDPGIADGGTPLSYVEPHELIELRRVVTGSVPRFVSWRPVGSSGTDGSVMGAQQILIAPSKPDATVDWHFCARVRLGLSNPDDDVVTTPVLAADGSVPEVLPHETRLIARLAAFEMILRNNPDGQEDAQRIVRHVDQALLKSFTNARKLGQGASGEGGA